MNLYLISQPDSRVGYDTYDSAVVAATSAAAARKVHPGGYTRDDAYAWGGHNWVSDLKDVQVKLIGKAAPGTKAGVICASFNAG